MKIIKKSRDYDYPIDDCFSMNYQNTKYYFVVTNNDTQRMSL